MKRRSLFGLALGALAFPFVGRSRAKEVDHTDPERDGNGKAICRIYRRAGDGAYREIRRDQIRPGDRILMIGQDGDRLWKAEAVTVNDVFPPRNGDGGGVTLAPESELQNLLD